PEMDGAETKKKMKPIVHDWDFQPIVVGCSADNSQETQKKFYETGISHFLHKPVTAISITSLRTALQDQLNQFPKHRPVENKASNVGSGELIKRKSKSIVPESKEFDES